MEIDNDYRMAVTSLHELWDMGIYSLQDIKELVMWSYDENVGTDKYPEVDLRRAWEEENYKDFLVWFEYLSDEDYIRMVNGIWPSVIPKIMKIIDKPREIDQILEGIVYRLVIKFEDYLDHEYVPQHHQLRNLIINNILLKIKQEGGIIPYYGDIEFTDYTVDTRS